MQTACEGGELFALLEGGRESADELATLYAGVREPWLVRGLLAYHARTGSSRALDLLARAPEPHARLLLDALLEQLRAERASRRHALAALAPLVARRPPWLHRLATHPLARDLLRAAREEREPLPLLHALLALAALVPAAPALAAPHWPELTDALQHAAALEPPPPRAAAAHLQLARQALFHALYATHPCTLLEALRAEHAAREGGREAWRRALAPLLASVRLHPALVTGSRAREADAARWARLEPHDVVAECRRLSLPARDEERAARGSPAPPPPTPAPPPPGSGLAAARAAATLRPGAEPWFPLAERCGVDSAPHTPLPGEAEGGEPEAAVEATPENTPAKETRTQFRFPSDSSAVRAIGRRSQPPSPLRKETSPLGGAGGAVSAGPGGGEAYGGRLARVALDRAALEADGGGAGARRRGPDSPVPFGGAPPGGLLARPEPRVPGTALCLTPAPPDRDDREVRELTGAGGERDEAWAEEGGAERVRVEDPRAVEPRRGRGGGARRAGGAARRAASCGPGEGARQVTVAVQTVDNWPEPYEFLIADFYRSLPNDTPGKQEIGEQMDAVVPSSRLDAYLAELYSGRARASDGELAEQLALVHAQLMYERWRRDAHAERNRRLLGRCRQTRALELQAAALRDRVRALTRERDELRARLPRAPSPAPPAPDTARLEAALQDERRAAAAAHTRAAEAEERAARAEGELQRARAAGLEAARRAELLARAAHAAERRAELVRRLRRELLLLSEREARLAEAARAGLAGARGAEAAARGAAAAARAEAEGAEAGSARAEQAAARAHELEAQLAARDGQLVELRRRARLAADEAATRTAAVHDKYRALLRVVRAREEHALRAAARAGGGAVAAERGRRLPEPEDDGWGEAGGEEGGDS